MKTRNLWADSSKERFQGRALSQNISVDLAIIGAGYTGLSAAIEAAKNGADVAVLEAQTVGYGGSGRNVGLVNAGLWLTPQKIVSTMGQEAGSRLNTALAKAPNVVFDLIGKHNIECELIRNGTLQYAQTPSGQKQLVDRYRQLMALGAPVTLLSAAQAQQRTGSPQIYGALHDARAGTIQPLSYALGLARAAQNLGAKVFENTRVRSLEQIGSGWELTTANARVTARKILIATNAYFQPATGIELPKVTKVNFFQMSTDRLADDIVNSILPSKEGCWDTGPIMTSFRRDDENRFIIGGMGRPERFGIHQSWGKRAMAHLFPQLANIPFHFCWHGSISMTFDHIPRLLRIGTSGYAMFGYSGRGIGPGTVMGKAIANSLLSEDEAGLPLDPVDSFTEFAPGTKSLCYETGARLYHIVSRRIRTPI